MMELVKRYLELYQLTGQQWALDLALMGLEQLNWQVCRDYWPIVRSVARN